MLLVAAMCAALVAWFVNKKGAVLSGSFIALDALQIVAVFTRARVQWPDLVRQVLQILSAFNLNIELAAPECLLDFIDFKEKF